MVKGRTQDMMFLVNQNMEAIMAEARKGRASPEWTLTEKRQAWAFVKAYAGDDV